METKLDSRQGQFPATFPDTFKDFFAVMNEDENVELFSNLLEDKVIPRANRYNQRRCGGSLRCTNTSNNNVGRSNSFRVNRPTAAAAQGNYCKHIKYCCLHQKHYSQNFLDYKRREMPANEDDDGLENDVNIQKHKSSRQINLERQFDYENCDDSDTISTSSSTPTIPYNPLHRISTSLHNKKGGFHSKETLPRIVQQQCGLRDIVGLEGSPTSATISIGINSSSTSSLATSSSTAATITNTLSGGGGVGVGNNAGTTTTTVVTTIGSSRNNGNRPIVSLYSELSGSQIGINNKCFSDKLNCCTRPNTILPAKSPVLNRRRSSSIAATLLATDNKIFRNADELTWSQKIPHSNTRERLSHAKSPVNSISVHPSNRKTSADGGINSSSGVLTFKQAMSGAVSPQNYSSLSLIGLEGVGIDSTSNHNLMASSAGYGIGLRGISTPTGGQINVGNISPSSNSARVENFLSNNSNITIQQQNTTQKQRMRTSSMPVDRKPRLAETRRQAIHCADLDLEYYRLRSFSITSHGICNLGDSLRSRRSRSINSVTSTGTSNSGKGRNNSNTSKTSRTSGDIVMDHEQDSSGGGGSANTTGKTSIPAYKIAMLGSSSVGKTALTYQFTTSDYICAYDLSLDDDYGQKTVSVLVDGIETDLEIIDHPACEMSTEAFCSTYNVDLFVVVYSVVDKNSFKSAEKILNYLKECEMLLTRGAILVGNKTDLERHREVTRQMGRKLAKEIACKFIETSSGLDHNVNELLVGIVAQVKLNPQRIRKLTERERQRLCLNTTIQKHRRMDMPSRKMIKKQQSICHPDSENDETNVTTLPSSTISSSSSPGKSSLSAINTTTDQINNSNNNKFNQLLLNKSGPIRKSTKRVLNLENILRVGESEIEDDDDGYRPDYTKNQNDQNKKKTVKLPLSSSSVCTSDTSSCSSTRLMIKKTTKNINTNSSSSGGGGGSSSSPSKIQNSYDNSSYSQTIIQTESNDNLSNILDDPIGNTNSCRKSVSKLSNRTKIFLTSVLKFKKNLNVKRRSSSSCSDLFVI